MEEDEASLPDHLRCNRTDGRQWRCTRRVMDGKKLCGIHHLQLRHRQHKEKVPESLKLQRKRKRTVIVGRDLKVRAKNRTDQVKMTTTTKKKKKKRGSVGVSEALDSAVKRMKLRKGDLQLDLIRTFLQRQVERRRKIKLKEEEEVVGGGRSSSSSGSDEGELMRDLPNGLMAISSTPLPQHSGNAGSCGIKLGFDPSRFNRRCFRSKNIEPLPVGAMQVA